MAAKTQPLALEFPVSVPAEAVAPSLPDPIPTPTPEAAAPAKAPEDGQEAARLAFPEPAAAAPIRPAMTRGPSPRHLIGKLAEVMGAVGWITKRGYNEDRKSVV